MNSFGLSNFFRHRFFYVLVMLQTENPRLRSMRHQAACIIQSAWRGFLARRVVRRKREQQQSAHHKFMTGQTYSKQTQALEEAKSRQNNARVFSYETGAFIDDIGHRTDHINHVIPGCASLPPESRPAEPILSQTDPARGQSLHRQCPLPLLRRHRPLAYAVRPGRQDIQSRGQGSIRELQADAYGHARGAGPAP